MPTCQEGWKPHRRRLRSPPARARAACPPGFPSAGPLPQRRDHDAHLTDGAGDRPGRDPEHVANDGPTTTPAPVVIKPVAKLHAATSWKSDRLQLGMQADGNLVLYDRQEKRVMWAAGTSGKDNMAAFQDDGNLVIRTAAGRAIWASNPAGFTNATLVIQPDGNVVIRAGGKQVWATNTHI
ncbi:hypothetical protein NKH18_24655 [Streptomyces sp. M10(2022)]